MFVLKDRNSFEEFSQTIAKREPAAAIHGHADVRPDLKEAYIVVEDRESAPRAERAGGPISPNS